MATRFRLPASGTPIIAPALQSYTHAASVSRVPLLTADTTALANLVLAPDGADHTSAGDTFFRQFIYGPLAPQTFTSGDAFKYAVQALEANAGNNLQVQIWMGIYSQDGGTLRGAIRSKVAEGTEVNTSLRNVFYSGTLDGTVDALDGDWLVIEFSLTGTPVASGGVQGHNGTLRFGSNGAGGDLPENDTETGTTFNPWIEFNVTVQPIKGLRRYRTTQVIAASDVATTTYTITCTDPTTGATFQPVAVIAHYSGRSSTGAGEGSTMWGRGVAVSATSRRSSVWHAVQASATIDNQGANRDDALITEIDATPAVTGRVDVDAFLGHGFRLIVDDQLAADILVELEAIGGDLTCAIATITAPAGTGDQDINVGLDLTGGLDNKGVLFFGPGLQVSTINNVVGGNGHAELGMAAGDTVAQWAMCWRNVSAGATSDTLRYMRSGECIASNSSGASPNLRASLTTWLSTGFRLNWAETASGQLIFALAIKGQRWYAGTDETRTDTNTEQILTAYKPLLMFAASHCTTESASDTFQDHVKVSIGVAVSASSRACISMVDADNLADSDIAIGFHTDRIYNNFDESNADKSTIIGAMDVSSFDNNGVTFVMDDADPSAAFFGYLIGADERYAAVTLPAIASGSTLAAPSVAHVVTNGTIAAGSTLFAPTVDQAAGSQSVTTGTIAAGSALYAPTVIQNVTGATIAAGSAVYAPSVQHVVTTGTIASGSQLFAATIAVGAVTVVGGTIASGVQTFAPTLGQVVIAGTIAAGSQTFAPTVATGAITVTGATIAAGNQRFAPSVAVGAVTVTGAHIASTAALLAPTLAYAVTTGTRSSTAVLFAPSVTTTYAVTGGTIAAGNALFAPSLTVGSVTVTGAHIGSTVTMFGPTVTGQGAISGSHIASTLVLFGPTITTGAVSVTGAFIASGNQRFAPSVAREIRAAFRASTASLFAPTVTPQQAVAGAHRASTAALFAPRLAYAVTGSTISGGSQTFAPTVAYRVTTAHRGTTRVLFAPAIVEEKAVTTAFRASTAQLFAPRVATGITTGTIGSTATVRAPSLAYRIAAVAIASSAVLFAPVLSYTQDVTGAHIGSTVALYGPGLTGGAFTGKAVITEVYVRHPVTMTAYGRQSISLLAYTRQPVQADSYIGDATEVSAYIREPVQMTTYVRPEDA